MGKHTKYDIEFNFNVAVLYEDELNHCVSGKGYNGIMK